MLAAGAARRGQVGSPNLLGMPEDAPHLPRDDRPDESRRARLSRTFDEDAELYDRARPGYPPALYDDLTRLAGIGAGRRVLEIGCGTGQATVPLALLGCRITAVEAGPRTAAVARRNLSRFAAQVDVVPVEFESGPLPDELFDVVLAATAFHWIDPAVRVHRAADALRSGGALAVVRSRHVRGGSEGFRRGPEVLRALRPRPPPACCFPPPTTWTARTTRPRWRGAGASAAWSPVATSRTSPVPPPSTWTCRGPVPVTARLRRRRGTDCCTARKV